MEHTVRSIFSLLPSFLCDTSNALVFFLLPYSLLVSSLLVFFWSSQLCLVLSGGLVGLVGRAALSKSGSVLVGLLLSSFLCVSLFILRFDCYRLGLLLTGELRGWERGVGVQ